MKIFFSIQIAGETIDGINLFGFFMKPGSDISEETAFEGKDAVGHVSSEFYVGFGKEIGNFIGKSCGDFIIHKKGMILSGVFS